MVSVVNINASAAITITNVRESLSFRLNPEEYINKAIAVIATPAVNICESISRTEVTVTCKSEFEIEKTITRVFRRIVPFLDWGNIDQRNRIVDNQA